MSRLVLPLLASNSIPQHPALCSRAPSPRACHQLILSLPIATRDAAHPLETCARFPSSPMPYGAYRWPVAVGQRSADHCVCTTTIFRRPFQLVFKTSFARAVAPLHLLSPHTSESRGCDELQERNRHYSTLRTRTSPPVPLLPILSPCLELL